MYTIVVWNYNIPLYLKTKWMRSILSEGLKIRLFWNISQNSRKTLSYWCHLLVNSNHAVDIFLWVLQNCSEQFFCEQLLMNDCTGNLWTTIQPVFTCWKLTIETIEQGVKYAIDIVLVSLLLTLNILHILFQCFWCWLWTCNCRLGIIFLLLNSLTPGVH